MTEEQSMKILSKYLDKASSEVMDFKNHRKFILKGRNKVFRFTLDLLSLDFLVSLGKDKKVKNVYWNPSTPPPGGSIDSISLRYKVYVEYH